MGHGSHACCSTAERHGHGIMRTCASTKLLTLDVDVNGAPSASQKSPQELPGSLPQRFTCTPPLSDSDSMVERSLPSCYHEQLAFFAHAAAVILCLERLKQHLARNMLSLSGAAVG